MLHYNGQTFTPGTLVTCVIQDSIINGHIHIEKNRMWICHDSPKLDGDPSPNKWGHQYSWTFSVLLSGRLSDEVYDLKSLGNLPPYKEVSFDNRYSKRDSQTYRWLSQVLSRHDLVYAFNFKVRPFEEFDNVYASEKPGFIKLSGVVNTKNGKFPKEVEIKLSRYLKKVSDEIYNYQFKNKSESPVYRLFTDSQIEKIYNSFVALQSGSFFKLKIVQGKDINYGYTGSNYTKVNSSTLHKSCMTDQLSFLSLYRQNDNISLAILESENGIEARSLIWESVDGTKYFDRIYYSADWIEKVLADKLKEQGYINVREICENVIVELKNVNFSEYPYIDSFNHHLIDPETHKPLNTFIYCQNESIVRHKPFRLYTKVDGSFHKMDRR